MVVFFHGVRRGSTRLSRISDLRAIDLTFLFLVYNTRVNSRLPSVLVYPPRIRQAYDIFVEVLGRDHEEVGSALNLLAVVLGEQGRYLEVPQQDVYRCPAACLTK